MYTRRERPLSDAERQSLRLQVQSHTDGLLGVVGLLGTILAIDSLMLTASWLMDWRDGSSWRLNICGGVLWLGMMAIVNLFGAIGFSELFRAFRQRRRIRQALADGVAVVERLTIRRLAYVSGTDERWFLLAVGPDAVAVLYGEETPYHYAQSRADPKASGQVPACFDTVTTRRHRWRLDTRMRGRAGINMPSALELNKVIADAASATAAEARLEKRPLVLRGSLADLPALLIAPDVLDDVPGGEWDELQARIEERFQLDFGPGGLERLRPTNVSELVDLIRRRLPENATCSDPAARPAFYRLRAALVAELGVPRSAVRPRTRLEDLVPRRGRRRVWKRLVERMGQPVEAFAWQDTMGCSIISWAVCLLACWGLGLPLWALAASYAQLHDLTHLWHFRAVGTLATLMPWLTVAVFAVLGLLIWRRENRIEFNGERPTVGDLARSIAVASAERPWTEETVLQAVCRIVATTHGCRPMAVRWTTRLVEIG